jgi:flavin-dependent dehydrogenase
MMFMHAASYSQAVVIGAGPVGLGVSLGLASKGISVIIIELQEKLGAVRRGETIRADKHMEEILGPGFFERITIKKVNKRRYFSHTGKCHVDRTIKNPNIIFAWPDLIGEIAAEAERIGVRVLTGVGVKTLLGGSGRVQGVITEMNGSEKEYFAHTVFSCGGCNDPASQYIKQERTGIDMPVAKRLVRGYTGPEDRLEYHFHHRPSGLVVGTMFPRGGGEAEFILLDTSSGKDTPLTFDKFSRHHPQFSRLLEGTQTHYELQTRIPLGGMLYPFSPCPGLVMAGDVLGHVQARGGSGIRTSFLIGHAAGILAADVIHSGGWSEDKMKRFENLMRTHPHVRSLRLHNLIYSYLRSRIFGFIDTPEEMDKKWNILKVALR